MSDKDSEVSFFILLLKNKFSCRKRNRYNAYLMVKEKKGVADFECNTDNNRG